MTTGSSPRSLLERGLAAAGTLCFIAVLLVVAVHLIESILLPLGILGGTLALGALMAWLSRRRRNRYW